MCTDGWHVTDSVELLLGRTLPFLESRPALHTMLLTVVEKLRAGAPVVVLGWLECSGGVRAAFYWLPGGGLCVTSLESEQADSLSRRLLALGHNPPYVSADLPTAALFGDAWQRHSGARPSLRVQLHLYRLGALTPPDPVPAGRGRAVRQRDQAQLVRWCREFAADVGEDVPADAGSWGGTRFAQKRYTFWETPDGTPVSMAGVNPMVGGQVRVDPVYTPAHLRGRGYAGAVTVAVSRAALEAGATDVVLFTDPANTTSNALYRRIGYRPVADWAAYDFAY
ncbi:GNAT family N-acetyltransferase [Streptomyces sp. NBC_01465]|uniref:GNAT family N-acetyltransferase n=1 Tax=Streptomyces sp. NBC_01465 TaxID=2903878 RepID=UPI002E35F0D1|nr:GNAT family N-acetyltransferase [Streptomyces sp. NBC_01465]